MTQTATPSPPAAPSPPPGNTVPPGASSPVPLPSLSPGETITWVRAERPTLDLVGVFLSSFWIVLIATIVALSTGVLLGVLRYRRRAATGFVRLPLRDSPGDTEHR